MRVPRLSAFVKSSRQRKHLNADALIATVRNCFASIPEPRQGSTSVPLSNAAMSAFAMFSLKDPSLLAFDQRRGELDSNLQSIYGMGVIPCDTQMRTILDPMAPDALRPAFRAVFRQLQRGKALEPFVFLDGHYLLSLDGTGFYSSEKIGSAACLIKTNKKTGQLTYQMQMLGACLVHPEKREVIPLFPEMICNGDGQTKNDCERNAARRWLKTFREDHPQLPVVITEDALSPNAPHIRDLKEHNCRFLLGVKPGDHKLLFDYVQYAHEHDLVTEHEMADPKDAQITHRFRFLDEVPLNQSNLNLVVNFIEYWQIGPDGKTQQHFTWVTDLPVTTDTVYPLMRGGRARWRIENETFNTLKNQGYHFGHNYGLGKQHLAGVLTTLMMLAFLVDQVQQHCCKLFQAAWKKLGSKRALWDKLRSRFESFRFTSMAELLQSIVRGIVRKPPELLPDTS